MLQPRLTWTGERNRCQSRLAAGSRAALIRGGTWADRAWAGGIASGSRFVLRWPGWILEVRLANDLCPWFILQGNELTFLSLLGKSTCWGQILAPGKTTTRLPWTRVMVCPRLRPAVRLSLVLKCEPRGALSSLEQIREGCVNGSCFQ